MSTERSPAHRGLMLMSIQPRFTDLILAGTKTIELRRTRPSVRPGQPVAIYATAPTAAVVATCEIERVLTGPPAELRKFVTPYAAVTEAEYDDYFDRASTAVAIHLSAVTRLHEPVELRQLRDGGAYHPPQTWHFLDRRRLRELMGTHTAHAPLAALI